MAELIILSLLVWVPVVFYEMSRRGFVLIVAWLFIAPIALNIVDRLGGTAVVERGAREDARSDAGGYLGSETKIRSRDMFNPTRLLFAGLLIVFLAETALKRRRLGRFDTTEKFALIFSLIVLASALLRANRTEFALRVAVDAFIIPFVAYFCARRLVTSEERLQQVMKVTGYMGLYIIPICAVERLLYGGHSLYYRVGGPFNDQFIVHVVMSISFLIASIDALGGWSVPRKARLFPDLVRNSILFMAPVVVAFTWTRGTWLAFLCSITVFVFLNRRFLPRSVRLIAAGTAFTMIPLIILSLASPGVEQIMDDRITGRARTAYSRLGAWTVILQAYSEAPIFGIGLNNLRDVLASTRVVVGGIRSETHAHNSFLTILGEQGAVGLLAFLGILASIFQLGRRLYRKGRSFEERVCGSLVVTIMIAYLVPALFANLLQIPRVHHIYVYTLIGAIAGYYSRHADAMHAVNYTRTHVSRASTEGRRFPVTNRIAASNPSR